MISSELVPRQIFVVPLFKKTTATLKTHVLHAKSLQVQYKVNTSEIYINETGTNEKDEGINSHIFLTEKGLAENDVDVTAITMI